MLTIPKNNAAVTTSNLATIPRHEAFLTQHFGISFVRHTFGIVPWIAPRRGHQTIYLPDRHPEWLPPLQEGHRLRQAQDLLSQSLSSSIKR